jgi:hypothetical protein
MMLLHTYSHILPLQTTDVDAYFGRELEIEIHIDLKSLYHFYILLLIINFTSIQ